MPILHLNGYKISGPTVFGRMSDEKLLNLFNGYGYEPFIVDGWNDIENVYEKMYEPDEGADGEEDHPEVVERVRLEGHV